MQAKAISRFSIIRFVFFISFPLFFKHFGKYFDVDYDATRSICACDVSGQTILVRAQLGSFHCVCPPSTDPSKKNRRPSAHVAFLLFLANLAKLCSVPSVVSCTIRVAVTRPTPIIPIAQLQRERDMQYSTYEGDRCRKRARKSAGSQHLL